MPLFRPLADHPIRDRCSNISTNNIISSINTNTVSLQRREYRVVPAQIHNMSTTTAAADADACTLPSRRVAKRFCFERNVRCGCPRADMAHVFFRSRACGGVGVPVFASKYALRRWFCQREISSQYQPVPVTTDY